MEVIYCKEGISQGGVLGMSLYGIATLIPLARSMREAIPGALQPWFADDSSGPMPIASTTRGTTLRIFPQGIQMHICVQS
jgi:hypothetical protein